MADLVQLLEDHEQLVLGRDKHTGVSFIVAIHSTALGPSLGGTRFYPYRSGDEAIADALSLSRAMTYKAAAADLDIGGGKGVIIGDPQRDKCETVLRAYGQLVESVGGRYYAACDVGTSPGDLAIVARETRFARGTDPAFGGSGDSAISTATGLFNGLKACARFRWGTDTLDGVHVAVQGVGKVGRRLVELLHAERAELTVADIDADLCADVAHRYGAEVVGPDEIHRVSADVYSPNAMGGALSPAVVEELRSDIVAGAANNQLAGPETAKLVQERGILYAPDFVINAGGLIQVVDELHPQGPSEERVSLAVGAIGGRLVDVFRLAQEHKITTAAAASRMAEDRILNVGKLRSFWTGAGT